jgi:lysophospholipase L1-like esterase
VNHLPRYSASIGWLGAALLACAALWLLVARPGVADAALWRLERYQPLPTLTQRVFERRLLAHHMDQDRLVPKGATLFFGDSHIQTLPVGGIAQAYNFAIGGETAERLAKRLGRYRSLPDARAVVVGTGTNDLLEGRTREQLASAWEAILGRLPASALVVCVGLPQNDAHPVRGPAHAASNDLILALCRDRGHPTIDVVPGTGGFERAAFAPDGLHLNADGSLQLLRTIEKTLMEGKSRG